MSIPYEHNLTDLGDLELHARTAQAVSSCGRRALLLDGLVLAPTLQVEAATIEVDICAKGSAYPGVAFHVADVSNYELAYAAPHCSGLWDAIQYDPVFRGSNSWQLYHGELYQKAATVPTGDWFRLRIDLWQRHAAIRVGAQSPLVVPQLAHVHTSGRAGLWTYRPACFSNLRISPCHEPPALDGGRQPSPPPGALTEWFLDEYGCVQCEPSGTLNLNRYLPASANEAGLSRHFETLSDGEVELAFGFSDELSLELDGQVLFSGTNTFHGFDCYSDRGYAYPDAHSLHTRLEPGVHRLSARLKMTEPFGWGMVLAVRGEQVRLLPPSAA